MIKIKECNACGPGQENNVTEMKKFFVSGCKKNNVNKPSKNKVNEIK